MRIHREFSIFFNISFSRRHTLASGSERNLASSSTFLNGTPALPAWATLVVSNSLFARNVTMFSCEDGVGEHAQRTAEQRARRWTRGQTPTGGEKRETVACSEDETKAAGRSRTKNSGGRRRKSSSRPGPSRRVNIVCTCNLEIQVFLRGGKVHSSSRVTKLAFSRPSLLYGKHKRSEHQPTQSLSLSSLFVAKQLTCVALDDGFDGSRACICGSVCPTRNTLHRPNKKKQDKINTNERYERLRDRLRDTRGGIARHRVGGAGQESKSRDVDDRGR